MPDNVTLELRARNLTTQAFDEITGYLKYLETTSKETTDGASQGFEHLFETMVGGVAAGELLATGIEKALDVIKEIPGALLEMGERGGQIVDVENAFDRLAGGADRAREILAALNAGTKDTVPNFELLKNANKLLADGFHGTADQFGIMGAGARLLSKDLALQGGTAEAMDVLSQAMATGRSRALNLIGVHIDADAALAHYSATIGKSVSDFTAQDKVVANSTETLRLLKARLDEAGDTELSFGEKIQQSKKAFADFMEEIEEGIAKSPVLAAGMDAAGKAVIAAFGDNQQAAVKAVVDAVDELAIDVTKFASVAVEGVRFLGNAWYGLEAIVTAVMKQGIDDQVQALIPLDLLAKTLVKIGGPAAVAFGLVDEGITAVMDKAAPLEARLGKTFDGALDSASTFNSVIDKTQLALVKTTDAMLAAKGAHEATAAAAGKHGVAIGGLGDQYTKLGTTEDAWAKAVQAITNKITTSDLAGLVKQWDEALTAAGGASNLSAAGLKMVGDEALKLRAAGETLTPALSDVALDIESLELHAKTGAGALQDMALAFLAAQQAALLYTKAVPTGSVGDFGSVKGVNPGGNNSPIYDSGLAKSFFDSIQPRQDDLTKSTVDWDKALKSVGSDITALGNEIGGTFGQIVNDIGQATKAAQGAQKSFSDMHDAGAGTPTGILDAVAGVTQLASAAIEAGKAVVSMWNHFFGSAGRDAVVAFADTFKTATMDGFDALHKELLTAGLANGVGEQFWKDLTQDVGKNDKAGAQSVIAQIQQALADAPDSLAAAAGYQTIDQLQAVADKAKEVYDYMVSSGKYTAAEIADAFQKMGDAQKATFSSTQSAAIDAATAARDAMQKTVDGLTSQIQSLQQSVNAEAPEETMGVIEAAQRAQLAALQKQQQDAQSQLDEFNQQIQDATNAAVSAAQSAASAAGKTTVDAIQDALDHNTFHVKVAVDTTGGGSGGGDDGSLPKHEEGSAVVVFSRAIVLGTILPKTKPIAPPAPSQPNALVSA